MATYSFLDVNCSINGPGGAFGLGSGAGNAEEGIDVVPSEALNNMAIGADGSGMHSLRANYSGKITVRLLKTSPVNKQLMDMLNTQKTSGSLWGQNTISLTNSATGDSIIGAQAAFDKVPDLKYATTGGMNEWSWDCINISETLGAP